MKRDAEFGRQGLQQRAQDIGYDQFGRQLSQQDQQFGREQDLNEYVNRSNVDLRQQQQDTADRLGQGDLDYRNRNLDVNQLMQQQQN